MPTDSELSHVNTKGEAHMVNISAKPETHRVAVCDGWVLVSKEAFEAIRDDKAKKGDVLATARIAGISAVKRTADLIPLCHPIRVSKSALDLDLLPPEQIPQDILLARPDAGGAIKIVARVEAVDRTGVEMEAMTALSVTALTTYDMIKAVDRGVVSSHFRLLEKRGGKSADWNREDSIYADL